MPSPMRFLAIASLFLAVSAVVPPGKQGALDQPVDDTPAPTPDNDAIADTAGQVNQKSSVPVTAVPSDNVPATTVTALDGDLVNATVASVVDSSSRRRKRQSSQPGEYVEIFYPLAPGVHDASIEGTAYLTYTVVNNATYNIKDCLAFCDKVDGCEFVNLYYEFNNELLDFVFSEKSNLKCAAYGDIHTAAEKTNFGGQASYPQVGNETVPLTYITQSSGWAAKDLTDPATPEGFSLVFGPTGGANNAPGYMGFAFLDRYDPEACAALCNGRGYDPVGGVCQYFNIWRAVVDGVPTTYTCSMYYLVADNSTAVNFGQGDLVVTLSRGYARNSVVIDGGFEGFTECDDFCFDTSYKNWVGTSQAGGDDDATIFFFNQYAHTGHGSGLLGAAFGDDSDSGTLTPAQPLKTKAGRNYVVQVFVNNAFSGAQLEAPAVVNVLWNGKVVGSVKGFQQYTPEQFNVVATGYDVLAFEGGAAPAWSFIDDVFVALL
ncbi:hypothetical protein FB45DRAFT_1034111 [Roridomyces roridus]|uniref:Fruit-body specific protein a n=1 Tax=Roridomyces roridus TaxID=1738132 RepID=A0AAD7BE52_9AGAR|nr:hypothetical protein FB45DRAFT_1034111 [Roridomyces roridus]